MAKKKTITPSLEELKESFTKAVKSRQRSIKIEDDQVVKISSLPSADKVSTGDLAVVVVNGQTQRANVSQLQPNLEPYATKDYVDGKVENIDIPDVDLSELNEAISTLETDIKRLDQEQEVQDNSITKLEDSQTTQGESIDSINETLEEQSDEIERVSNQVSSQNYLLNQFDKRIKTNTRDIKLLEDKVDNLDLPDFNIDEYATVEYVNEKDDLIRDSIEDITTELGTINGTLEEHTNDIEELYNSKASKEDLESAIPDLDGLVTTEEFDEHEKRNAASTVVLEAEILKVASEVVLNYQDIERNQKAITNHDGRITQLEEEINGIEGNSGDIKGTQSWVNGTWDISNNVDANVKQCKVHTDRTAIVLNKDLIEQNDNNWENILAPYPSELGLEIDGTIYGLVVEYQGRAGQNSRSHNFRILSHNLPDNVENQTIVGIYPDFVATIGSKFITTEESKADDKAVYDSLYNDIVNIEEEVEALAPSFERGEWLRDSEANYPRPPAAKSFYLAGRPTGDIFVNVTEYKDVTSIMLHKTDANDTGHTFNDINIGQFIELFNETDSDFLLGEITNKVGGTDFIELVVNVNKSIGQVADKVRVKVFTLADANLDLSGYATLAEENEFQEKQEFNKNVTLKGVETTIQPQLSSRWHKFSVTPPKNADGTNNTSEAYGVDFYLDSGNTWKNQFKISNRNGVAFSVRGGEDINGQLHKEWKYSGPQAEDDHLATVKYVKDAVEGIEIPDVDLTGYATEDYVQEEINKIEIPEPDLSDYMTEEETVDFVDKMDKLTLVNAKLEAAALDQEYAVPLTGNSTKTGKLILKTNEATPFEIQASNGTAIFKMWNSGAVAMLKDYSEFKDNELVTKKYVDDKVGSGGGSGFTQGDRVCATSAGATSVGGFYIENGNLYCKVN